MINLWAEKGCLVQNFGRLIGWLHCFWTNDISAHFMAEMQKEKEEGLGPVRDPFECMLQQQKDHLLAFSILS